MCIYKKITETCVEFYNRDLNSRTLCYMCRPGVYIAEEFPE